MTAHDAFASAWSKLDELNIAKHELEMEISYYESVKRNRTLAFIKMEITLHTINLQIKYWKAVLDHLNTLDNGRHYSPEDLLGDIDISFSQESTCQPKQ